MKDESVLLDKVTPPKSQKEKGELVAETLIREIEIRRRKLNPQSFSPAKKEPQTG